MLSGVQTGNGTPHDKHNIRGIAHARTTENMTFSCKDEWSKALHYIEVVARDFYIDAAHTALDIFCFAVFFLDASASQ